METPPPFAAATVYVASHQAYNFGVLIIELALLADSLVTTTAPNFNNPAAFTEMFPYVFPWNTKSKPIGVNAETAPNAEPPLTMFVPPEISE